MTATPTAPTNATPAHRFIRIGVLVSAGLHLGLVVALALSPTWSPATSIEPPAEVTITIASVAFAEPNANADPSPSSLESEPTVTPPLSPPPAQPPARRPSLEASVADVVKEGITKKAQTSTVVTPVITDNQAPQATNQASIPALDDQQTAKAPGTLLTASDTDNATLTAADVDPKASLDAMPDALVAMSTPSQRPDRHDVRPNQHRLKTLLKSLVERDAALKSGATEQKPTTTTTQLASTNNALATLTKPPTASPSANTPRPLATLTAADVAAIRVQYRQCWRVLSSTAQADDVAVIIRITLNDDLSVRQATVLQTPSHPTPKYLSAVNQALSAIRHPACNPLHLTPGAFQSGDQLVLNFNPASILR